MIRKVTLLRWSLVFISFFLAYFLVKKFAGRSRDFKSCPDQPREYQPRDWVPNHIHYTHFDLSDLSFVSFICILSAHFNHKPEKIIVHTNLNIEDLNDKRWSKLRRILQKTLVFRKVKKPSHIFGKAIGNVFHSNDIYKINLAHQEGGIFLDQDTFILKSLNKFRKYEFTIGWPEDQFIGIQIFLSVPGSAFSKLWINSYKDYRPDIWYYNGGQNPTDSILRKCPNVVNRVKVDFGVHDLTKLLYDQNDISGLSGFSSVHLLASHRSYLNTNDVRDSKIKEFDEDNIKNYNKTFGIMARSILEEAQHHL